MSLLSKPKDFFGSTDYLKIIETYVDNPIACAREQFQMEPDDWQAKVLMDLVHNPRVAIQSAHGLGKSCVEAIAINWFMLCHPFAKVPTTAPNFDRQVRGVLWSEVHKWFRRSKLMLEMFDLTTVTMRHKLFPEDWYALGFSVEMSEAKDESVTMEGFHAPHILIVVDEGKGVPASVFDSFKGAMTGPHACLLMASTPPPDPVGYFVDALTKHRSMWVVTKVSAYDSPRFSKQMIEDLKQEWGEDSAIFQAKVLGEIPKGGSKSFFPSYLIENGQARIVKDDKPPCVLGVDIARAGSDFSAFCIRRGANITRMERLPLHLDTMEVVGVIMKWCQQEKPDYVAIDSTGIGAGVYDRFSEILLERENSPVFKDSFLKGIKAYAVELGSKPNDDMHYKNLRAELHDALRLGLVEDLICLPKSNVLYEEMVDIGFKYDSLGRLVIESKEDMKKRGKASPDMLDSLILSFYRPEQAWVPSDQPMDWMSR